MAKPTLFDRALIKVLSWQLNRERRSSLENPQTPLSYPAEWLLDIFNGGRTDSGIRVSEMTALQVSTVLSCVNIVSNGVATLPRHIYELKRVGSRQSKTVAYEHKMYDLLAHEGNIEMSATILWRVFMVHALLWGNGYIEIERNGNNDIINLWPRNPARTRPIRALIDFTQEGTKYPRGTMLYETYESMGESRILQDDNPSNDYTPRRLILAEDMLHIHGLTLDGRLGSNTIQLARQTIGLALAQEKYGAKFYGNQAIPAGILSVAGDVTPIQWETIKRSWQEAYGGENVFRTGVLPPGVKYEKISATPAESMVLEGRKFERESIAALFNVPPHMIGEIQRSTKSTVEQTATEFVLFGLSPWLSVIEAELKRKLFPKNGRSAGKYIMKHDTRKLLYPDADSRAKFYIAGKQGGFLNTNDIRELEDMNPVEKPSGEIYWMPVNMVDADTAAMISEHSQQALDKGIDSHPGVHVIPPGTEKVGADKADGKDGKDDKEPPTPEKKPKPKPSRSAIVETYVKGLSPVFHDAVRRVIARKQPKESDYLATLVPVMTTMAATVADGILQHLTSPTLTNGDIIVTRTTKIAAITDEEGHEVEPAREETWEEIDTSVLGPFIANYVRGMYGRSALWTKESADGIATMECKRAIIALVYKVYSLMGAADTRNFGSDDMPFYLGRHGETEDNAKKKYREWTTVPLLPEGRKYVEAVAEELKKLDPPIARIISCDLIRTTQSAEIYSKVLGVPVEYDPNLRTWGHGFGGKTKDDAHDDLMYFVKHADEMPPNGKETFNAFLSRVTTAIDAHRKQNAQLGPTLDITSGSDIVVYGKTGDAATEAMDTGIVVGPGGVVRVNADGTYEVIDDGAKDKSKAS